MSQISQANTTPFPSGIHSGMDRRIEKNKFPKKLWATLGGICVLVVLGFYLKNRFVPGQSYTIDKNRLAISATTRGAFEDFIPITAYVAPLKTVFLDAVQGGRVEEILTEDGALVEAHQAIIRLSNSDLQLNVMNTESRLMEQLNYMRDQELRFEQNRLKHKRDIVDLDFEIKNLTRNIDRKGVLFSQGHISQSENEDLQNRLSHLNKRRAISIESQQSDEQLIGTQLAFFKRKSRHLEENLLLARKSLEALVVRSPVSGRLSGFDMEIGQNVSRGLRVGQVSAPNTFKLISHIDEYYLNRVRPQQHATFERNGVSYTAKISKIYPSVKDGRFQIELGIIGTPPNDFKPGQSLQAKLVLGDVSDALLIPNGPFFVDTGGKWVFVVNKQGTRAEKVNVTLGRRNSRFIEVRSGLSLGDRVVTSGYNNFKHVNYLVLQKE